MHELRACCHAPMTELQHEATSLDALAEIEHQVLWLSTAIVHHANLIRPNPGGLKVGGHQASSASMVSIMTSLWFRHLRAEDRVSVKPHASPVLHAINYLLGELDESYLPTLRAYRGLQSYPSRVKDPDPVDYSTGSVGIGATAPIWGAMARRYLTNRFTADGAPAPGRQYSLLGDAELDEGAVWEAVVDPGVAELGEVVWVVDVNRQSLDRVVPLMAADRLRGMFTAAGWQVITLKYGRLLEELFTRPGGDALRHRIDAMPNPEYQRLLRLHPDELRRRLPGGDESLARLVADLDDAALTRALRNLGGHDLRSLDEAYRAIDDTRPTIILAYTIKGYGLAIEGHPQNHSALLTEAQLSELAAQLGADPGQPWNRGADSAAGALCAGVARRLKRPPTPGQAPPAVPADLGRTPAGVATTQAALGRALLDLTREAPEAARRVVTVSPDVSSSTNLGGWVNKVGVWSPGSGPTGSPTTPRQSCTGRRSRPASTSSSASRKPTWSGCSASSARPGAAGASRCSRSACCTTRLSSGRSSRGRSASTPAASRSWSAPRPGSRSPPRAGRTSRSPPRPSASSSPAA